MEQNTYRSTMKTTRLAARTVSELGITTTTVCVIFEEMTASSALNQRRSTVKDIEARNRDREPKESSF